MPACYPSTSEVEVGESGVESHPRLCSKFRARRSNHRLFQNDSTEGNKNIYSLVVELRPGMGKVIGSIAAPQT